MKSIEYMYLPTNEFEVRVLLSNSSDFYKELVFLTYFDTRREAEAFLKMSPEHLALTYGYMVEYPNSFLDSVIVELWGKMRNRRGREYHDIYAKNIFHRHDLLVSYERS